MYIDAAHGVAMQTQRQAAFRFLSGPGLHCVARMTDVTASAVDETLALSCGLRGVRFR